MFSGLSVFIYFPGRDCYLCVYRNATEGGMVSGLEQCSDHFHYQNVMKARCDTGYCKVSIN